MLYSNILSDTIPEPRDRARIKMRITAFIAILASLFFLCLQTFCGTAYAADGLQMSSDTTYTVTGQGRVSVNVGLDITNNDPSTTQNQFGTSFYYAGVSVQVISGYERLSVVSSGGSRLAVSSKSFQPDSPIQLISIDLDKKLFYGDRYRINISYELGNIRTENIFISPNYLYFPVFTIGNSTSRLNIDAPAGFKAIVSNANCAKKGAGGNSVICTIERSDMIGWAEIMDPGERSIITDQVKIGETSYPMEVDFFKGEEQWAQSTLTLIQRAIPLLHNEYSVPIPQSFKILIKETGLSETQGYAGQYRCDEKAKTCTIVALPPQSSSTLVHETSHMWSFLYGATWISEGWAEFTAKKLSAKLGYQVKSPDVKKGNYDQFPLDKWTNPQELLTSTNEEKLAVQLYYAKSADFIETLYRAVGENNLRLTNQAVAKMETPPNSQTYFDKLEEVSKINLDGLFLKWVYGAGAEATINERRQTINDIAAFDAELSPLGLEVPATVIKFRAAWDFKQAGSEILAARQVLPRLAAVHEVLDEGTDPLTALILKIIDPNRFYTGAVSAFNDGNYNKAVLLADQAEKIHSYGPMNGLWLVAIFGLVVILLVFRSMRKKI